MGDYVDSSLECTKKKRKCDKQFPCARCRRLNLDCSRETVQIRRNIVRHAAETEFLSSIVAQLETCSAERLPDIIQSLRNRIFRLQSGNDAMQSELPCKAVVQEAQNSSSENHQVSLQYDFKEGFSEHTDPSLLTAIEHLAWGRNSAGCFPHRRCACQYRRDSVELLSMNSQLFHFFGSSWESLIRIPNPTDAEKLVRFHIRHLAWHHNCLHTPTFLEQCEVFWKTGRCDHPLWMALYFSVLSCTVSSIQNSDNSKELVGVNLETLQSAQDLFSAMVQILYNFHFLNSISIHSVQAIVISTEVAHNIGLSQLNATLFNAAVRIAECLGLHKIDDHSPAISQTGDEWDEKVEREVGKRVWCQMVIQDHFAIPFTDAYSISPMQFSTEPPLNADDYDLFHMPANVPTVSTYVRVLMEMAALMPELVDGLGPMKQRKPLREQYEHILRIDRKMRSIVTDIPSFLLRADRDKEAQIPWLRIARRSLAITAAEKIIMIHRPFLFRSFHSQIYNHSRRTCVAAAITILREHEMATNEDDLSIWTHTAFCITGVVILCFEVNAISDTDDPVMDVYRTAITAARGRLASRNCDVLAHRGVALIDAIFIAEKSNGSRKLIDFSRIVSNFSTLSKWILRPDCDGTPIGESSTQALANGQVGIYMDNMQWNSVHEIDTDFDTWFNGIFY